MQSGHGLAGIRCHAREVNDLFTNTRLRPAIIHPTSLQCLHPRRPPSQICHHEGNRDHYRCPLDFPTAPRGAVTDNPAGLQVVRPAHRDIRMVNNMSTACAAEGRPLTSSQGRDIQFHHWPQRQWQVQYPGLHLFRPGHHQHDHSSGAKLTGAAQAGPLVSARCIAHVLTSLAIPGSDLQARPSRSYESQCHNRLRQQR
jgi:hypothetical protein